MYPMCFSVCLKTSAFTFIKFEGVDFFFFES
jgi:hypothetical protein